MRCIITAAIARDLRAEWPGVPLVKVPGATNGTVQAWDCNDRDAALAMNDAAATVYTRRADMPRALVQYLVAVYRSDSNTQRVGLRWLRLADCGAADYFRTTAGTVRTRATLLASEVPRDVMPLHVWAGDALDADASGDGQLDALGNL